MELLADQSKKNYKERISLLDAYTQKPNVSNTQKTILLKNITWHFNRKEDVLAVNGLSWGTTQKGNFSKDNLIYPEVKDNGKLILFSLGEMYRFSSRQIFDIEIGLK
ncbi:hypothetical protein ACTJKC_22170 [Pedobacter sp. 22226]|uniref:hypothetical protein n=1 Tax=Pedobacter sp. 22226 TaxID=3453894 RepID=UPI003F8441BC